MPKDERFSAGEKRTHKMTRDGLVERNEATGEERRVSRREPEFDLRTDPAEQQDGPAPGEQPGAGGGSIPENGAGGSVAAASDGTRHRQTGKARGQAGRQDGAQPGRQFDPEAARPEAAPEGRDAPAPSRLNFSADELPPEPLGKKLTNARRRAERAGEKLEKAKGKIPTHRKLRVRKEFDAETGVVRQGLRFEKVAKTQSQHLKGPVVLRPVKAAGKSGLRYGHKKISQVEEENVGIKAAHRTEQAAERLGRSALRFHKTRPYRKAAKWEVRSAKANARAAYQQVLHDNPKLKNSPLARAWQKQKIKRQYDKAAREANRAARQAGGLAGRAAGAVAGFVRRHPAIVGVLAGLLLLVFIIMTLFSSCSNLGGGGFSAILMSSYLAADRDIDDAELAYTEWETDLLLRVNNAETEYPNYDEYRYSVADVSHDPYELMAWLTAAYQDFRFSDVQPVLRQVFEEQYSLSFVPEVEIRTRTVTKTRPVYDETTGAYLGEEEYEEEEEYEWHVLNITLTVRSFTNLVLARMGADETEIYSVLMQTYGNRQYIGNVFRFNWLPYVSCYYGYRVHPITGEKDYHKAVDIAVAQGTEILAGHDGVVTTAANDSSYGLYVVLEGALPGGQAITTKYAHCSQLLVSPGQQVSAGEVIARVGSTGESTGPHLHLEVIVDGQYLNPLYFATTGDDGSGRRPPGSPGGPAYGNPGAAMGDGSFAALMTEAELHLGKPYRYGANGPDSFDCSSFVCWVFTRSGVHYLPRTSAQGVYNQCTPVSPGEAKPGDLIFFTGTFSTPNVVSHVGIYIGNGMMIHAGNPIQYANINTSYWQTHFYSFGRITG